VAQVFPLNDDGAARDDARLNLAGTIASLPQEWTAVRDRSLVVDAVLVHPDMGVALVSLVPIAPEAAVVTLRERLSDEHFEEFFPGALPIVVLGITPADIPQLEQRLAAAFRRTPKLAIIDRDWADAVVALLLASSDLEMRPAGRFAVPQPEAIDSVGALDTEVERAAVPPSFSRSRFLALRADDDAVRPPPAPRRSDWLVPVVCAIVFVAELGVIGVAFSGVNVGGLLPHSTSPGMRTETDPLRALETAPTGGEQWRAPAPEGPHVLLAAKPLMTLSPEPPTEMAPVANDWAKLKYDEAFKVAKSRHPPVNSSRPAPTVKGSEHHASIHRDQNALAEEIYHPGRRAPGW
jgi:hypothetical protein